VQAKFVSLLIHAKKYFSQDLAGIHTHCLNYRHVADYKESLTSEKTAKRCYEKAELLVMEIKKKIGESA
jgi:hypothetical protein